jgi:predicted acyltransferase
MSDRTPHPLPSDSASRIASVDALRGLVITLMVFVNDVAGARHAPPWLKHVGIDFDGMTLPDIVFPAFLFIAGVSIPLSLGRALDQGQSRRQVLGRVLPRVFALLVMGVVMVNGEEHEPWPRGLWNTLAFAAMFLAFAVVPSQPGRARAILRAGRLAGAIALIALVLVHRDAEGHAIILGPLFDATDTVWLRHSWWGILGLIGWAYLVGALVYLVLGRRREWLVGAAGLLTLLYLAAEADLAGQLASRTWLAWATPPLVATQAVLGWINSQVGLGGTLGSQAGLTVAGACLGSILTAGSDVRTPAERLRWALIFAGGLALAGLLLDAPHGINKIRATPAWCLYCASITTVAWALLFWLMDIRGRRPWARLVQPAGANPLLAYLLHPFFCYVMWLIGGPVASAVFYYRSLPAPLAVLGSLVMALAVVQATGWIARAGYRLKV